jgi:hypothetical protein
MPHDPSKGPPKAGELGCGRATCATRCVQKAQAAELPQAWYWQQAVILGHKVAAASSRLELAHSTLYGSQDEAAACPGRATWMPSASIVRQ